VIVAIRSDKLPAIIDLPDGTFVLRPDPQRVRQFRVITWSAAAGMFGSTAVVLLVTINNPYISWVTRVVFLVVISGIDLFLLYAMQLPVLKAEAERVAYLGPLNRRRMSRADLAFIFRGLVFQRGRKPSWQQSYLFVANDGQPGISIPASSFTTDGMSELAQRLEVPIRGDFSTQVKGRVPL
jgi:hypothetical protein